MAVFWGSEGKRRGYLAIGREGGILGLGGEEGERPRGKGGEIEKAMNKSLN